MERSEMPEKVDQSLESLEGISRATPAPYLLTRINARLLKETQPNFWSRAGAFLSRPVTAVCGLTLFLIINVVAVNVFDKTNSSRSSGASAQPATNYDFAINVSGIYDIENQEP